MSNDAAAFAYATDRMIASPERGFRRWAPTRPVTQPNRQPATGPPGSYPDRTHTGKRRRASDQNTILDDHLLIPGRTPCSTNGASPQPDEACHRRLPTRGQALAGTRGQGGRPPPLATPMNVDRDAKGVCAGQVRCRCAVERAEPTLRQPNPSRKSI